MDRIGLAEDRAKPIGHKARIVVVGNRDRDLLQSGQRQAQQVLHIGREVEGVMGLRLLLKALLRPCAAAATRSAIAPRPWHRRRHGARPIRSRSRCNMSGMPPERSKATTGRAGAESLENHGREGVLPGRQHEGIGGGQKSLDGRSGSRPGGRCRSPARPPARPPSQSSQLRDPCRRPSKNARAAGGRFGLGLQRAPERQEEIKALAHVGVAHADDERARPPRCRARRGRARPPSAEKLTFL